MSVLFLRFFVNILCLQIYFVSFSEFNKENKIYQHAKSSVSGKGFVVDEEDPKFLEDLHESDEEEKEEGDDFEVGDEYDKNRVSCQNQEPTNLTQKTVSCATAV